MRSIPLALALLLIGSVSALTCPTPSLPVCGLNGVDYANQSNATASGVLVVYCGTCHDYAISQSYFNTYSNLSNSSLLNVTSRSYMERFISSSFATLIGNSKFGDPLLAILIGGFFFVFVSFQNTRIEAKAVILIPAFALAAVFVGWLISILALVVGIIIYIGLARLFNK